MRLSNAPKETGQDVGHERLFSPEITIEVPGYIYIYVSNEEASPLDIYLDDFEVQYVKSPVIQMNDYYPFGLTFNSYQRENSLDQKYLYNGKARQDELQLGWYDYGARTCMPDVGRWGVTDPLADKCFDFSPYNYAANNPVVFTDPTGAYITICYEEDGRKKEYRYESGTGYEGNNSFVANTVAQLDY